MNTVSRLIPLASVIAAACVTAMSGSAMARPEVVREDPTVIEERLHHMGFVEWRRLRWDNGFWKIDDARRANGHVYDLKLEAGTFDIVRLARERD